MRYLLFLMAVGVLLTGCSTCFPPQYTGKYHNSPARPLADAGWKALAAKDYSGVQKITSQCISLFGQEAASYNEACGRKNKIPFVVDCSLLNEVAECRAVQILMYRDTNQRDLLQEACQDIYQHYSHSQVWDPKGWYWTVPGLCDDLLGPGGRHSL